MRTSTFVNSHEVIAIVLDDIALQITSTCAKVKSSIEAAEFGWAKKMTRDFLVPTASTTIITRNKSDRKRK